MATVPELKAKIAEIDAQLIPLKAAAQEAKIKTDQAQAALDVYYNTPGHINLSAKINAQNAVKADPNNVQLQQNLEAINIQWAKQSAELGPLLAARDAAFQAQIAANAPVVKLDAEAGQYEVEIAKIDPSQATPDAVTYLKENGGLPITTSSDPALTTPAPTEPTTVQNSAPATTTDPNTDPNTNIGAEAQVAPQVPVDDGSDPYVSNGTTNVETVENFSPEAIGGEDPFEAARLAREEEDNNTPPRTEQDVIGAYGGMQGLQGSVENARARQITQDAENAKTQGDWRVRLSLAPGAGYLYKANNPGILAPLQSTDGVVFPYTPQIQINYAAHYDPTELTHSNYKVYQYKNSSVDQITITCDFTAQDTAEANYLLATIHFFRSVTKMFYGQDQNPKPGTPPPLCYLSGLGAFQFDKHPLVISGFNYSLPNDVDYIRAGSPTLQPGVDASMYQYSEDPGAVDDGVSCRRLGANGLVAGGGTPPPKFNNSATNKEPTYVPTKIQISISAYPIVSRGDISSKFSLRDYATGSLLQGSKRDGGGIW